jgi:geranylgeranyl pyrophosphate synthase
MERIEPPFAAYWEHLETILNEHVPAYVQVYFPELTQPERGTVEKLLRGGKKLRGRLLLLVCDALGGSIDGALDPAVALECIQAASLIHDDLVDEDRTRREQPAAWTVHGSRRAVLLADLMFATALRCSAEMGRLQALSLSRAIANVAAGAYKEPLTVRETHDAQGVPKEGLYDRIIHLKTGTLFGAAAEMGALAARTTPLLREAASEYGVRLGEAYQIADDLHDVVRDAGSRALSVPQLATLASLYEYFVGSRGGDTLRDASELLRAVNRTAGALECAMEVEMERRIELARRALESFPERPATRLLHVLPAAVLFQPLTAVTTAEP